MGHFTKALCLLPFLASAAFADPLDPRAVHGVLTRYEIDHQNLSVQYSIVPDLANQDLQTWALNLESMGVNLGVISVLPSQASDPACALAEAPVISDADWNAYMEAYYLPEAKRTAGQRALVVRVRGTISALNCTHNYTLAQRDRMILDFLNRLEVLRLEGKIAGRLRFLFDQRLWFRDNLTDAERMSLEAQYAGDMADLINRLGPLDHWIAGTRLFEHSNRVMDQLLPIIVDLGARINGLTNGWLRNHLMVVNGGGWGADYEGINEVVCPAGADPKNRSFDRSYQFACAAGAPFPFFELIARQSGSFAFGYKWMEFNNVEYFGRTEDYIGGVMRAYCQLYLPGCDPQNLTAANWQAFLRDNVNGLGFDGLVNFIASHAAAYPHHANVIFVGDSSDSLYEMTTTSGCPRGRGLCDLPQLQALRQLFQRGVASGGGWTGILALDGVDDLDNLVTPGETDVGRSLTFKNYSEMLESGPNQLSWQPWSTVNWMSWPYAN